MAKVNKNAAKAPQQKAEGKKKKRQNQGQINEPE